MGNDKAICKWEKPRFSEDLDELKRIVARPRYVCTKCGRAARDRDRLCKPAPL